MKGDEVLCEAKILYTLQGDPTFSYIHDDHAFSYFGHNKSVVNTLHSVLGKDVTCTKKCAVNFMASWLILHNN